MPAPHHTPRDRRASPRAPASRHRATLALAAALALATPPATRAGQPAPAPPAAPHGSLAAFVRAEVAAFHQRRLERLASLELDRVLARKNPYLLRAKSLESPRAIVDELLDSHLASQEAGIFGDVMEHIALEVCRRAFGGRKSAVEGIDLEFERDGARYIVSVKSGPHWGNSSQIAKMRDYFRKAKRTLHTNSPEAPRVVAVNGCCYGSTPTEDRGDYLKLCGKNFWQLISGDDQLYLDIINLIGDESRAQNAAFEEARAHVADEFAREFCTKFCDADGTIRWHDIVALGSR